MTETQNIKAQNSPVKPIQSEQKLLNVNKKDEGKSLNLCWQNTSDANSAGLMPTLSATQTLISLSNGDLKALNVFDGSQLWASTLGGEIEISPLITDKSVFVVNKVQMQTSEQTDEKPIENSSKAENPLNVNTSKDLGETVNKTFIVRSLSAATGLTLWQRTFAATSISIAKDETKIFVALGGSTDSSILTALNKKTGAEEWSRNLYSNFIYSLKVQSESVFLMTENGFINVFESKSGVDKSKFKFDKFVPSQFAPYSNILILGDAAGNIAVIDTLTRQTLWKLRVGGATQSFLPTQNGVLIASLDNFAYFHSLSKGKRLWRRRLAGRPIGGLIFGEKFALICISGDDSATIINLQDGKVVGEVFLGVDNYAISAPTTNEKFIVVQTVKGLMNFTISQSDCQKSL